MISNAIRAYGTAKGYVQSTYLIVTADNRFQAPDDTSFILAYHLLLGFAVELYLKSYLTHADFDAIELRRFNIRHNLNTLLDLSTSRGFNLPSAQILIDYLNGQHGTFEYRYMKPDSEYYIRYQAEVFRELSDLGYVDKG